MNGGTLREQTSAHGYYAVVCCSFMQRMPLSSCGLELSGQLLGTVMHAGRHAYDPNPKPYVKSLCVLGAFLVPTAYATV